MLYQILTELHTLSAPGVITKAAPQQRGPAAFHCAVLFPACPQIIYEQILKFGKVLLDQGEYKTSAVHEE